MSYTKLARIVLSSLFVGFCLMTNHFFNTIKKINDCPCNKGWKISNGIILTNIFMIVNMFNLILPINKLLYSIPLIGSSYMFLYGLFLFLILYIVMSVVHELKKEECKSCRVDSINTIYNLFKDTTIQHCTYSTILLVIIGFWL